MQLQAAGGPSPELTEPVPTGAPSTEDLSGIASGTFEQPSVGWPLLMQSTDGNTLLVAPHDHFHEQISV